MMDWTFVWPRSRPHVPGQAARLSARVLPPFLLPNTLLIVLALATGAIGGEYGVPYLVWHDDPVKQFWVGFALALVVPRRRSTSASCSGARRPAGRIACAVPGADRSRELRPVRELLRVGRRAARGAGRCSGRALVLLVQKVDAGTTHAVEAPARRDGGPEQHHAAAAELRALAAARCCDRGARVFLGGWVAKHAIRFVSTPDPDRSRHASS